MPEKIKLPRKDLIVYAGGEVYPASNSMHWNRSIISVVVCGLLAGCVHYQPQPLSSAKSAAQLESRSLDNPELKHFLELNLNHRLDEWPMKRWSFDALTLTAFYYQPSLEVARAQWRISQAEIITAGGRPNPTIGATPGYDFSATGGANPWIPAVTLDWPIETAGKRDHRLDRAKHLSESARWNLVSAAWQVRGNVRRSLLDYSGARRQAALLGAQVAAQEDILRLLEQRIEAGALSRSEVLPMRVQLEKSRQDLRQAQSRASDARVRLAVALGLPSEKLNGLEFALEDASFPAATSLTSAAARQQALQGRSDILSALSEYAASQSALQLEIAKQYPDVHLGTGYQWDQGDHKWQLGLTAEIPVINRNQGPIAEAQARRAETAARFTALQAKVMGEIDTALAAYRLANDQMNASESLFTAQRSVAESVEVQLQAGAADRLDLLTAQMDLRLTEIAREDNHAKLLDSLAALEDAVQLPIKSMESLLTENSSKQTAKKEKHK